MGWYSRVPGDTLAEAIADSLDAALADAMAALPDRLRGLIGLTVESGLQASAWAEDVTTLETLARADGPTPAAALRALTAKLREV